MKQNYKVPNWLHEAFILRVLSQSGETQIKLNEFTIDSATQKGDNFASEMFRIVVNYCEADLSEVIVRNLILKKTHTDPKISKMIQHSDIYRKEINCYRTYLPEFQKILATVGITEKLAPEVIYFDMENEVLVMEDLSVQGFRTAEKSSRLSMDLAKMTLRKLALFHVSSIIYNEREGRQLENVKNEIFTEHLKEMFDLNLDAAVAEIQSWGADFSKYVPDLKFIRNNFAEIIDATLVPSEGMGVFMHGDMWLNNIMVQYAENKSANDIVLLDFQLSGWASRAIDVIYFIFTTLNEVDYMQNFDEVLRVYNDEFSALLEKFNYKYIPEFSQFQEEVEKKLPYGIVTTYRYITFQLTRLFILFSAIRGNLCKVDHLQREFRKLRCGFSSKQQSRTYPRAKF